MSNLNWGTIIPLIGGSAIGCWQATGTKPNFHLSYSAFDANEKHLQNYWPDVPRILLDENQKLNLNEVDFVNSVCPCAGLSQLSTSRDIETREGKNYWMYESARIMLNEVRPRVYFGENAPGLFTKSGAYVRDKLKAMAKDSGYSFSLYKTNTLLHGIPQRRIRTFYFFWRDTKSPILEFLKSPTPKFYDYIQQIPKDATLQDKFNISGKASEAYYSYGFILEYLSVTHEDFVRNNDSTAVHSVYTYIVENNMLNECIAYMKNKVDPDNKEFKRLLSIKKKVDGGGRFMDGSPGFYYDRTNAIVGRTLTHLMHPLENRGMSIRELLHMMGMPHDFQLEGKNSLNHIAQNVPTCTARDMANQVVKYLNGGLELTNADFIMQDNIKEETKECEL